MKKELDERLCKEFPLLYGNRRRSMKETCMCWGFSCGDGWFDIIYRLSAQLEPLIQKVVDENPRGRCNTCGCKFFEHRGMPSGLRICTTVNKLPYRLGSNHFGCCIPQWKRDMGYAWSGRYEQKTSRVKRVWKAFRILIKNDWKYTKFRNLHRGIYRPINKGLSQLSKLGLYYKKACDCLTWEQRYPRAAQVKEKFGTLSFYMDCGNTEIYKLITAAEKESASVCEHCGVPGTLRDGGWVHTFCDACQTKYEEGQI